MVIISSKRIFVTADGKELVEPSDKRADSLFAIPGQRIDPKRLARLVNAQDYFGEKRVAPEPEAPRAKAPKIKGPKTE